jgi:hypothetical protein
VVFAVFVGVDRLVRVHAARRAARDRSRGRTGRGVLISAIRRR